MANTLRHLFCAFIVALGVVFTVGCTTQLEFDEMDHQEPFDDGSSFNIAVVQVDAYAQRKQRRQLPSALGDVTGDGKADLVTISKSGGGGWANWAAVEISTGSGFTSRTWATPTPQHMRNGNRHRDYQSILMDVDGNGRLDLVTVSKNGGGGWRDWASVDRSTGDAFSSSVRAMSTPIHMRNGGL